MKRRDFIKAGFASGLGIALTPTHAAAQIFGSQEKDYIEYNRGVCDPLEGLSNYVTGEEFEQDSFVLAYFATPYQTYQGCDTDALNIVQGARLAEMMTGVRIQPVLVLSPLEEGDPAPNFAKAYTNTDPSRGNLNMIGLTGDKDDVLKTARSYRASFEVDRNSKKVIGHNRSPVLVSPDGDLLVKYSPSIIRSLHGPLTHHIQEFNARDVRPANGCDY